MGIFNALKIPAESLYNKTCTIYGYTSLRDEETGIDSTQETLLYTDVPCRISYKSIPNANQTNTVASVTQTIKLYCSPEYNIEPGSRIVCGDLVYKSSGQPAIYTSHQEIELISEKEWA